MSDELIVDIPAIEAAAVRIRAIASAIADLPFDEYLASGMGDPDVQAAADDFGTAWDGVLDSVTGAVDYLRVAMTNAITAYQATDTQLATPSPTPTPSAGPTSAPTPTSSAPTAPPSPSPGPAPSPTSSPTP